VALIADAGEPLRTLGNPAQRWLEILPKRAALERLRELQTPAVETLAQAIAAEEQQRARN
jgi:hypothetical protein